MLTMINEYDQGITPQSSIAKKSKKSWTQRLSSLCAILCWTMPGRGIACHCCADKREKRDSWKGKYFV